MYVNVSTFDTFPRLGQDVFRHLLNVVIGFNERNGAGFEHVGTPDDIPFHRPLESVDRDVHDKNLVRVPALPIGTFPGVNVTGAFFQGYAGASWAV